MGVARVETVTILFTDLVGYTRLESRVGPVAAEELRGSISGCCETSSATLGAVR